jgi:hypothetical protein
MLLLLVPVLVLVVLLRSLKRSLILQRYCFWCWEGLALALTFPIALWPTGLAPPFALL